MPDVQFNFEVNDAVSGAMDSIAAAGEKAFAQDKTLARFNAGLGQSEETTIRMGELARKVWTDGWGGSLEDVTGAIGEVGSQMVDLGATSPEEIEKLTKGALDLAEVMGADVTEVTRAAGQMMKNGLAPDAQAAFDIIATGATNGANRSGDLLDTLSEYSGNFAELGISGPTALGMINSALDAGIFTTDVAADAMREFGTRVTDGSATAAGAFTTLGLNADEMTSKIAAGGPAAAEATNQIFTALGTITDPVARETAGVALFGSMWEDMGGKAIMAMDPTIAKTGEVAGATEDMGNKLHDVATAKVDRLKRGFEDWTNSMIATDGPMGDVSAFAVTFGPQALSTAGSVAMIATAFRGTAIGARMAQASAGSFANAAPAMAAKLGVLTIAIAGIIDGIERIKTNWDIYQEIKNGDPSRVGEISAMGVGSVKGIAGIFGIDIPGNAAGGITKRPHLSWVGEGGESELILPLSKAPAVLGEALGDMGGRGGGITMPVTVNGFVGDKDALAQTIVDTLVGAQRRGMIPAGTFGN